MQLRISMLILATLAAACATGKTQGQSDVEDLTRAVGDFQKSLMKAREELKSTMTEYDAVANNKDGDLLGHFKKFNRGLDDVAKRQAKVKKDLDDMKASAGVLFQRWEKNLETIQAEDLRARSRARMEVTKRRFADLQAVGARSREVYAPLMTTLRDHATFWSSDLNPDSAAALRGDAATVQTQVNDLNASIDTVLAACDEYNKAVASRQ